VRKENSQLIQRLCWYEALICAERTNKSAMIKFVLLALSQLHINKGVNRVHHHFGLSSFIKRNAQSLKKFSTSILVE
jgi:hypothetical protein